jgi:hypothetical protein
MLSPYSGSINPSSLTGIAKYINYVKSPYNERINYWLGSRNLIQQWEKVRVNFLTLSELAIFSKLKLNLT